ncbi:hypothetical protein MUK42_03687 [Musa troglodytarum]|uniref:Uncharacterized protein n=1 Tax=Musa troglodytarum TaxID=320322 RepID=A0A9E7GS95_9LILI|nr:hypothetical protein MUK42_03687 [Musa troglodytarum]
MACHFPLSTCLLPSGFRLKAKAEETWRKAKGSNQERCGVVVETKFFPCCSLIELSASFHGIKVVESLYSSPTAATIKEDHETKYVDH